MKRPPHLRVLLPLVIALPFVVAPAHAEQAIDLDAVEDPAAPPAKGGPGVMVRPFDGPRSKTIHDRLVRALTSDGTNLVPASSARTRLGKDPGAYVKVASGNGIRAFIHGKIQMSKKSWTLTLEVRSGATGEITGSDEIKSGWLPGLLKAIDKEAPGKVAALVETTPSGGSSPAAAVVDLESGATSEASASADTSDLGLGAQSNGSNPIDSQAIVDNTRPPALFLHLGVAGIYRSFTYSDPFLDTKRQGLFPHAIPLVAVRLDGMWYPGMHFGDGVLSHFGLNVHFIRSLVGNTAVDEDKVPNGAPTEYPTVFQELDLGLRARIPMGNWEMGLNFGVGSQQMGLVGDNAVVRLPYSDVNEPYPGVIPDIDSRYYRFGADVGFPWLGGDWSIGAGMRLPDFAADPGAIAHPRWFPSVVGTAATVSLGVNIPMSGSFGLQLLADYRQTGMDMNSSTDSIVVVSESDPNQNQLTNSIAGGAIDRYILLSAGITWGAGGAQTSPSSTSEEPTVDGDESADESQEAEEEASDPAAPSAPTKREPDTSNPAFFGEAAGGGSTKNPPSPAKRSPAGQKDTSNPDFFK